MTDDLISLLKNTPPFSQLSDEELTKLIANSEKVSYTHNQIVVSQSEKTVNYIFIVLKGIAKNILLNENHEEITLKTYGRGEIFGLIHAISGEGFSYTIRAVNNVSFLLVPFSIFEELMANYPSFTEEVTRLITLRLRELYKQMEKETSVPSSTQQGSPYRKKMVELMTQPVLTCQKEENILTVARSLLSHGVGSVLVVDEHEQPIGIITEKDLLKVFVAQSEPGNSANDFISAEKTMTTPLVTISPDAFYYDALHLMLKNNIKHLPVIEQGATFGMITTKNLIDSFANHGFRLIREIESVTSYKELILLKPQVNQLLHVMMQQHATSKELAAIITEINERITQKIILFAEAEMILDGYGTPPVSYCWLSLGSEGRKEQTLQTDQDNAIIYDDVSDEQQDFIDTYFKRLAEKIVESLDEYGFPKCTGGVMATNSEWRNSVSGWMDSIQMWYQKRSPEMLRQFTIFYDFRPIYGDLKLAQQVRDEFNNNSSPVFCHLLAEDESRYEVAITRFGRIVTQKGALFGLVDIKHGGIMHFVNGLRMLSLKFKVSAINSWERIEALQALGIFTADEAEEIAQAFDDLMLYRIKRNNHNIDPRKLSKKERIQLKKALLTARWFQQKSIWQCAMPGSFIRGF